MLETNSLGLIGSVAPGNPGKQIYESVPAILVSGFVLWFIYWLLSEIFLKA